MVEQYELPFALNERQSEAGKGNEDGSQERLGNLSGTRWRCVACKTEAKLLFDIVERINWRAYECS